jgi:hypothetical protein
VDGIDGPSNEARKRFKLCSDKESTARKRFVNDIRFAEGDSDNRWQWEDTAFQARMDAQKPALTVNKTREHNLQILNDQRQNKSQIKIRPVGGGRPSRQRRSSRASSGISNISPGAGSL